MKKNEKLIASVVTVALGILLIALKVVTVQIVASVFGVLLVVLGILNLAYKQTLIGALECVFGVLIIAFGWWISSVVLYLLSICLFLIAFWLIFEFWRGRCERSFSVASLLQYVQPILIILIGVFLFFHQGDDREWVFVVAGIFTVLEGAIMFAYAVKTIE